MFRKLLSFIKKSDTVDSSIENRGAVKDWKSIDHQIEIFRNRGLQILEEQKLRSYLSGPGYYRFIGHYKVIPGLKEPENLKNLSDIDLIALHDLNENLATIILSATLCLEESLKGGISYHLGKYSPTFHLDDKNYATDVKSKFDKEIATLKKQWGEASKSPFVEHHNKIRGGFGEAPIWVFLQVVKLGVFNTWLKKLREEFVNSSWEHIREISNIRFEQHSWIFDFVEKARNQVAHQCICWSSLCNYPNAVKSINSLLLSKHREPKSNFLINKKDLNVIVVTLFLIALVYVPDQKLKLKAKLLTTVRQSWNFQIIREQLFLKNLDIPVNCAIEEYISHLMDILEKFKNELSAKRK